MDESEGFEIIVRYKGIEIAQIHDSLSDRLVEQVVHDYVMKVLLNAIKEDGLAEAIAKAGSQDS